MQGTTNVSRVYKPTTMYLEVMADAFMADVSRGYKQISYK